MVTTYGMSDLGPIQYNHGSQNVFLGRDYNSPANASSQVAFEIDQEVRKIIDYAHDLATSIINERKDDLIKIAEALIVNETLTAEEIDEVLKGNLVIKDDRLVSINAKPVEEETKVETETEVLDAEVVNTEVVNEEKAETQEENKEAE